MANRTFDEEAVKNGGDVAAIFTFYSRRAIAKWHSLCSLRKQITEPRALAALRFPCQILLSRLVPAAHFEQSECHWAIASV